MKVGSPLVLLVEDDDNQVALLRAAATAAAVGWRLDVARGGEEAMFALTGGLTPDAVILDLGLPAMSGLEILAWLGGADAPSDVPVVVRSSTVDPVWKEAAMALGAVGFVSKSSDFHEVTRLVLDVNGLCRPAGGQRLSAG